MSDITLRELRKELKREGVKFSTYRVVGIIRKRKVVRVRWRIHDTTTQFYKFVIAEAGVLRNGKPWGKISTRTEEYTEEEDKEEFLSNKFDSLTEWFVELLKVYSEDKDRLEWM